MKSTGGMREESNWQLYIILCSDDSLYTGITIDLERRFKQHAAGSGAKYFRGRQPLQVVYAETGHSRSSASRREVQIKGMGRAEKLELIAACPNTYSIKPSKWH